MLPIMILNIDTKVSLVTVTKVKFTVKSIFCFFTKINLLNNFDVYLLNKNERGFL